MEKVKLKGFLISVLSFVMLIIFSGCGQAKKVQHQEEKQDGSSWEKGYE